MGYPTTYTYALDEKGNRIPKRDKEGNIVTNAQGDVVYKKEVDKKGVIDWIDEIKNYIEKEMRKISASKWYGQKDRSA